MALRHVLIYYWFIDIYMVDYFMVRLLENFIAKDWVRSRKNSYRWLCWHKTSPSHSSVQLASSVSVIVIVVVGTPIHPSSRIETSTGQKTSSYFASSPHSFEWVVHLVYMKNINYSFVAKFIIEPTCSQKFIIPVVPDVLL